MKYSKKIIVFVILLEVINLLVGVINNGKDAFLSITGFNAPPLYYDMDSLYGVTRQKNTRQMIQYPWKGVVNQTNSYGFRDEEFANGGTLVVGNSFVEGYGINNEDRFSEKLEEKLNTVVHNAGSGGVWTPIQGVVLLEHMIKTEKLDFDKIVFVMTPAEIINLGKRNPENDPGRNYPYKDGNNISFHKAKHNSFGADLSLSNKIKRFCKSLLMFKIYNMFKYYGAAKVKGKTLDFDKNKLDWLFQKIEEKKLGKVVDVVVIDNLRRTKLKAIETYHTNTTSIRFHVVQFPDELRNYFVSNGHLNEKGNTVLAELLKPIF